MTHILTVMLTIWCQVPDQSVIMLADRDGQADLYQFHLKKASWTRLTHDRRPEFYPKMDAEGRIIFTAPVGDRAELFYKADNKEAIQLTHSPDGFSVMEPYFDQDRSFILYNRISDNLRDEKATAVTGEIWRCNIDGEDHKRVIENEGLHFNPVTRNNELLVVANDHRTYFDHPLALFSYDFKTKTRKRLTPGFEAHGSWYGEGKVLAIHYQSDDKDVPTNVYLIDIGKPPSAWRALGDPAWGDNVRLPNKDATGRYVIVTARPPDTDAKTVDVMSSYAGYRLWLIDLESNTRTAMTPTSISVEGAWFIPLKNR